MMMMMMMMGSPVESLPPRKMGTQLKQRLNGWDGDHRYDLD